MSRQQYIPIIEHIFFAHYSDGIIEFEFVRSEISDAAQAVGVEPPKNLGDVVYTFRFRAELPEGILKTQPSGLEWVIKLAGTGKYRFVLVSINRVVPNPNLMTIKIPDATPEIVLSHALDDEQALLAKVRYNRLLDIFVGVTAYSLQNHLRTTVKDMGQIEIDEIYVAVDRHGRQFVLPVQAKGGSDQIGMVQAEQDIIWAAQKYPYLICRAIAAQFIQDDRIALFELALEDGQIKVVEEKHYRLVPGDFVSDGDLVKYGETARD